MCCIGLFCASAVELSRSGRATGSGFRWIAAVGDGAFSICMPASREGTLAEPFSFALRPMRFHGAGGQGGAGFGASLRSVVALVVYVCQRVGRVSVLNIFSFACALNFYLTRGWRFGGSLQLVAAHSVD